FGGGNDTVNIGNNGSVQNIQGALTIQNSKGSTALTVDDSADTMLHTSVVLSESSLTGLASAAINYRQGDLRSLSVRLGNASGAVGNIVAVTNTPDSGFSGGIMTTITTGIASSNNNLVYVAATTGPLTVNIGNNGQTVGSAVFLGNAALRLDGIQ